MNNKGAGESTLGKIVIVTFLVVVVLFITGVIPGLTNDIHAFNPSNDFDQDNEDAKRLVDASDDCPCGPDEIREITELGGRYCFAGYVPWDENKCKAADFIAKKRADDKELRQFIWVTTAEYGSLCAYQETNCRNLINEEPDFEKKFRDGKIVVE